MIGDADGLIKQVELFYTTMVTFDKRTIFIPNSQVTDAKIMNYSRERERRVQIDLGLDYSTPVELAKETLIGVAKVDERILADPEPVVVILAYEDSAVRYSLRAWVKTEDYWDVFFALNERVNKALREKGISITYNHLNVHILGEKKD